VPPSSPQEPAQGRHSGSGGQDGPRRGGRLFWLILGAFILLRLAQALTSTFSFDDEDGYTAMAAWELLQGAGWPYQAYLLSDWEIGTLLSVLVAAPLAYLMGPSLFVLKLTALIFSCLTLAGIFLLAREAINQRAALIACALFALFPGPLLHYSQVAHGFHPESTALQMLFFWQVFVILRGRVTPGRVFLTALLGGIAISFAYISALAVLCGAVVLLVALWRRGERSLLSGVAVLGIMTGLLPWWIYNLDNHFLGLTVYRESALTSFFSLADLSGKADHFLQKTLPTLLHFSDWSDHPRPLLSLFNGVFWALAALALLWPLARRLVYRRQARTSGAATPGPLVSHRRDSDQSSPALAADGGVPRRLRATSTRPPRFYPSAAMSRRSTDRNPCDEPLVEFPLLLLLLLSLFVFFASGHPIYPWHLYPLLAFLLIPLASCLAGQGSSSSRVVRGVGLTLFTLFCVMGGWVNLAEIHPGQAGVSLSLDGRNRPLFYDRLRDLAGRNPPLLSLDNMHKWLRLPLEGIMAGRGKTGFHTSFFGDDIYFMLGGDQPLENLRRFVHQPAYSEFGHKKQVVAGYAFSRALEYGQVTPSAVLDLAGGLPPEAVLPLMEGLGFGLSREQLAELLRQMGRRPQGAGALRQWSQWMAFGMGRGVRAFVFYGAEEPHCGESLPRPLRSAYAAGLGYGMACRLVHPAIESAEERVCPGLRDAFARGFRRRPGRCLAR